MKIRTAVLLALLCLVRMESFAQKDSLPGERNAAQDTLLVHQSQQLQQITILRTADSLKRADLEKQINDLHATDNLRKETLLKELAALKQKDSVQLAQQKQKIDSLRHFVKGVPVFFFQDTLFMIYDRQGSFSPRERAEAIERRIRQLSTDYFFQPDSLAVISSGSTTDIAYKELIIMGISENDALWMQMSAASLATLYKEKIATAIRYYRHETSWQTILKEVLQAVFVIAVLVLLVYATGRAVKWARRKIIAQKGKRIKGIKIRGYALFTAERQVAFLFVMTKIFRWVIVLITVYLALLALFSIFPWTKDFADTLLRYFLTPLKKIAIGIRNYIPNLVTIIVIVVVFRYLLKGIRFLKEEVENGALHIAGFYADWASPTYQIIRILVLAFMTIVIFPYLPGSESPVFKGISVFMGVLFTFGSAGALGNIVSGVVLTYMRSFRNGDRVKIGEVTGDVIERSLLVTRIRTIKNEIISIPNSTVMNSHAINYSSDAPDKGLIIHTTITIGYDESWRKVHALLIKAAQDTPLIEKEPMPFVLQTGLDDFYVNYEINAYTRHPNKQAAIYSDLYLRILDIFSEAGIEIMSPHYHVVRQDDTPAMPSKNS